MFPKAWSRERVEHEVMSAWDHRTIPDPAQPDVWYGTTESGVRIRGYTNLETGEMTTVFPLRGMGPDFVDPEHLPGGSGIPHSDRATRCAGIVYG